MKPLALALSVVLFTGCAAYKAQHQLAAPAPAAEHASHDMPLGDDDARPAKPVRATVDTDPLAVRGTMLVSEIDRYIDELKANGKYDCCVKPACRQCAITAGECHCREVISSDGPCCGECTQSWVEGRGNTEGVDREQVLQHLGCVRELYEKKVPEGMAAPAQRKDQ